MLRKPTSYASLALLLALTAAPVHLTSVALKPVLAQSASPTPFTLPDAVPSGTTLRVDGSTSMELVNQDLKRRFEERYSGTTVNLAAEGTDKALEALLAGTVDVAAIGRPLTAEERAKGLKEVPLDRQKIAIIVGPDNPFQGNLTFAQFARMFRGEITNWSQVGGPDLPIRFVDRPDFSDTRLALSKYKVFRDAPFQTGATATQVADDQTETVIQALGNDGISYAIAPQVENAANVRIISMHKTLPTDPRYPYSQHLAFVYKGDPSPAVLALLGFATTPPGQEVFAPAAAPVASPSPAVAETPIVSPSPAAIETPAVAPVETPAAAAPPTTAAEPSGGFPWWLLLLPLLGLGALAWWMKGRGAAPAAAPMPAPPPAPPPAPVAAVPPVAVAAAEESAAPSELATRAGSVIASDRAVISGATPPMNGAGLAAGAAIAGAGVAALGALASDRTVPKSRIILTPRNSEDAYAYWEAPDEHKAELRQQGGKDLKLRIYDVTDTEAEAPLPKEFQEYPLAEIDQDRHVPIAQSDRDYLAEIGYTTDNGTWLSLARSNAIRVPAPVPEAAAVGAIPAAGVGLAAVAGAGAVALGALAVGSSSGEPQSDRPTEKSRIVLTPRNSSEAYAYWEAPEAHKAEVRQQGGKDLKLRVFDVTGLDANASSQEYAIAETDQDRHVPIPLSDRDYVAEIGYTTDSGEWLSLARSNPVRVSADEPVETAPVEPVAVEPAVVEPVIVEPIEPEPIESVAVEPIAEPVAVEPIAEPVAVEPIAEPVAVEPIAEPVAVEPIAEPVAVEPIAEPVAVAPVVEEPEMVPVEPEPVAAEPEPEPIAPVEAASTGIHFPGGLVAGLAASGAVIAGAVALGGADEEDEQSTVEAAKFDVGQTDLSSETLADVDEGLGDLPDGYGESRIVLLPRDPQWGYAYWDTPQDHKQALRQQGGERLALRLYDVTDVDIDSQRPHSLQQYECDEMARNWYLPIPVSDRDYLVEIGYLAGDGRWLVLARSNTIRIPPVFPSDWFEDQFTTISWEEDLRGRTIATLIPPSQRTTDTGNPLYDEIFDMAQSTEAQRVAGSLFGSMQMAFGSQQMVPPQALPEQAISSYIFPSGVGMWAVPTVSGLTMSGVGFSASMPPIRSRKFWLVADAELIVYGATEPDATVTIAGRPVKLNPDGTFRFQMSFQDGLIDFPIMAVAVDGEQTRSIHMKFTRETPERNTNTKDEAKDEWF